MSWVIPLDEVRSEDRPRVGGKCAALARMARAGFTVPDTVCVLADAYAAYVDATGLRERIPLELSRKDFSDMRWEEIWDASLRIRNMFLNKPMPAPLRDALGDALSLRFGDRAVVVRSSAPGEDSARASFAGLHESFVNVRGTDAILEHVRLVWASLWSDAALLYRQELNLDVAHSAMAVLVQEIVVGERSGVTFSQSPNDPAQAVIESVYGLNQGLVDGTVEPDRWVLDRATGRLLSHTPAHRDQVVVPGTDGVRLEHLPAFQASRPPLLDAEALAVFDLALRSEELFGAPQDVEWTIHQEHLVVLQSRPITTISREGKDDKRPWYLSLRRSFENLKALRDRIEQELIPGMIEETQRLADEDLASLLDAELADEIERRSAIYDRWVDVYWAEFIPFAHGIRLFGQVYNDAVRPEDPYEFMDLLAGTGMASLDRNQALEELASAVRADPALAEALRNRDIASLDDGFLEKVDAFVREFGDLSCAITGGTACGPAPDALVRIVLEMASHPPTGARLQGRDVDALRKQFLDRFEGYQRAEYAELLDLARTSYQLRDDDNIHLGRIEAQVMAAVDEGIQRLRERGLADAEAGALDAGEVSRALRDPGYIPRPRGREDATPGDLRLKARQLIGQPAGPGISHGRARVILGPADLPAFQHGEILVCDAVDPNMTFVVPLAAGVIERRGGMLIHGAIIAREYGLPCVTGVPDAISLIETGDSLTVDGYLGIVTIG
jgi:pyruvate,water dikinase